MRTKLTAWLNTETCEPMFGVKVFVRGVWANLAIDGKAALYRPTLTTDQGAGLMSEIDLHFELRFMDDETVLCQLDLDEFQITVVKSELPNLPGRLWTTLIVSLSGAQVEAIKAIPLNQFNGKFEHASPQGQTKEGGR